MNSEITRLLERARQDVEAAIDLATRARDMPLRFELLDVARDLAELTGSKVRDGARAKA